MLKPAFVLSGGGAGGAFQVGAIKKLYENGIVPSHVYGTSVGALNGVGLRYLGIEKTEKYWLNIKGNSDVIKTRWLAYLGLADSFYSSVGLEKMLDEIFQNTPNDIEAIACAINIIDGQVHYSYASQDKNYRTMVSASVAVPFYMSPVGDFVDGGVRQHTPIQQAIRDGHKKIYVIVTNELENEHMLAKQGPIKGLFKSVKIGLAATEWLQREVFVANNTVCPGIDIKWIYPLKREIGTFEFDPQKIRFAIGDGYARCGQLLGI